MATTIEELQTEIAEMYGNLSQNDIDILRKLIGTDELRIAGRAVRILNQDSSSTTGYFSYTAAKLYYTNSEKFYHYL